MYGALQGLNKTETAEKFGEDQVKVLLLNISFQCALQMLSYKVPSKSVEILYF